MTDYRAFATTHWSVVLAARDNDPRAQESLEQLCQTYWYPIYAFVRRQGRSPHDAQDLTQLFFARFLEKDYLKDVDPALGRFRSFLLTSLKHFLANEWHRERAQKRGGGQRLIPLDELNAESRYRLEPQQELSAEVIYDRRWALTVLEKVLNRLREETSRAGKTGEFESLKVYLSADPAAPLYAQVGEQLSMSEGAVKVAVHRLRQRYRALLREEIAQTVARAEDVDDELTHLVNILAAG